MNQLVKDAGPAREPQFHKLFTPDTPFCFPVIPAIKNGTV